jgi:hypothetical protein
VLPLIVLLAAVALTQVRETAFWADRNGLRDIVRRRRRSPTFTPDVAGEPAGQAAVRSPGVTAGSDG